MQAAINGCDIYYEVIGEAAGKDAIFFIHGGPGLGDCRGDVLTFSDLQDEYQLVFIDMRGSGRSADVPPYTHKQWVDDIDALREHLGLDKIILHGASYGGFIVQEYVLAYPENTKAILLNVTAPDNDHHFKAIDNALQSDKTEIDKDSLIRLFDGKVESNDDFKKLYGDILPLYTMKQDVEAQKAKLDSIYFHYATHNEAFHSNLTSFDLKERLQEVTVPAMVTAGKHDWIIPPNYSKQIADRIPGATFVLFENYGHSLVREQGDVYKQLLRDFLNGKITEEFVSVDVN
ncbi:proline iminopeptidase [Salirhabdus euzebyi]|uniref:Proline iminopeptidase n=1 Tax=Salirhabdus euzebyi TaxID=394506 RepID=A0A841Q600_9BACI|nr:alpha/beta hydrolase [Salirhabdus euzebyi]MBB6453742.1 proline iminopeptidase [Salirhabdus euzebyi]